MEIYGGNMPIVLGKLGVYHYSRLNVGTKGEDERINNQMRRRIMQKYKKI